MKSAANPPAAAKTAITDANTKLTDLRRRLGLNQQQGGGGGGGGGFGGQQGNVRGQLGPDQGPDHGIDVDAHGAAGPRSAASCAKT